MFIAAQFTIAKCWKQLQCPSVNEWITKLWYIYTMEFYAAGRKKELLPFATAWMDLAGTLVIGKDILRAISRIYFLSLPLWLSQMGFPLSPMSEWVKSIPKATG